MTIQSIKSMTSFVQHHGQGDWGTAVWELRTVNNRYFDQTMRLPEELRELEPRIRELTRKYLQRGKLECQLRFKSKSADTASLAVDQHLLKSIMQAGKQVSAVVPDAIPFRLIDLLKWPGIISVQEVDVTAISTILVALYEEALQKLVAAREREGSALKEIILSRLQTMQHHIQKIMQLQPTILKTQREQLTQRIAEIEVEYDVPRFEQELVLLAQKSDVMEELERLTTHASEVERITKEGGVVGRQLDFFMQELNREANTLGAKSVNTEMTQTVVELKILIEQMREQIQNIE